MPRANGPDPGTDPDLTALAVEQAEGLRFLPGRFEWLDLDELEAHPRNPNEGDAGAVSTSIDRTGFYGLVIVQDRKASKESDKYRTLAGEHRWHALRMKGARRVPCWILDVPDAVALHVLLDNRWTRLGRDKPDVLVPLVRELAAEAEGWYGLGYEPDDLEAMTKDADETLNDAVDRAGGYGGGQGSDDRETCPCCGRPL